MGMLFFKDKFLNVSIILITAGNHFVAWFKTLQHFVIFLVLIAQRNIRTEGGFPVVAHLEYPVAPGLVVKSTAGNEHRLPFFTQCHQDLQRLAPADTFWHGTHKLHVHLEVTRSDLRKYFEYLQFIIAVGKSKMAL